MKFTTIALLLGAGYYFYSNKDKTKKQTTRKTEIENEVKFETIDKNTWKDDGNKIHAVINGRKVVLNKLV